MPRRLFLPCDELRASYLAGQTTLLLARRYTCSPTTIAKHLRQCGVELRSARFAAIVIDAAALQRVYVDERWPIGAIAAHFGVSASTVGNKRRRYGIPPRQRRLPSVAGETPEVMQRL